MVIKNNKFIFPLEVIYEIIKAMNKNPMENWFVMRYEFSDVSIFACTYVIRPKVLVVMAGFNNSMS